MPKIKVKEKTKKITVKEKESNLENEIHESERESFSKIVSGSGRKTDPTLEARRQVQQPIEEVQQRETESEEAREMRLYETRKSQERRRYAIPTTPALLPIENTILDRPRQDNDLSIAARESVTSRVNLEDWENEEERKYNLSEDNKLKTKRSRGWQL